MQQPPKTLVLVTGAAGFIGSNVARDLAEDPRYDVVVCDEFLHSESWRYLAPALVHDAILPHELPDWLTRNEGDVAAIVHMGAISATTETDLRKIVTNNVRLTIDLWEFAARNDVAFVYASSAATYGDGSGGFVDDDAPAALAALAPLNAYGWSKHMIDRRLIDDSIKGRPTPSRWAGLKFFNVYGPNEGHKGNMRSVVHQIYPIARAGAPVKLFKSDHPKYPDGGQLRDFIYVKDCSAVIRAVLDAPSVSGLFNVGTGQARSFADLAAAVFTALDLDPQIEYIDMPSQLRGKYQYFTQADTTKLRREGFAPSFHSLEDGIADYVNEYLRSELG